MEQYNDHSIGYWESIAYDEQYELICKEFGKRAADNANYGWGVDGDENWTSLATKVYGHGVLQTTLDLADGSTSHDWR